MRGCGENKDGVFRNDFYKEMTFEKTPEEGE